METQQSLTASLSSLAEQINERHALATKHATDAVVAARNAGESLIQAKNQVPHGQWLTWLEANCTVKPRQSQQYMRLAQHWDHEKLKSALNAHLSISGALALLSDKPQREAEPEPEAEDDGPTEGFEVTADLFDRDGRYFFVFRDEFDCPVYASFITHAASNEEHRWVHYSFVSARQMTATESTRGINQNYIPRMIEHEGLRDHPEYLGFEPCEPVWDNPWLEEAKGEPVAA